MVDVELRIYRADETNEEDTWVAEWGWRDGFIGVEDMTSDVTELVQTIVDDVTTWSKHPVQLVWDVSGESPANGTVADLLATADVTLPTTTRP